MSSRLPEMAIDADAAAARLMAGWWAEPTRDGVAQWLDPGWWLDAGDLWTRHGMAPGLTERLEATVGASFEELFDAYQQLFEGPGRVPCSPYESVWRTDVPRLVQGTVMGPAAIAVRELYKDLGLQVRADTHELPDHVAIELEALACGLDGHKGEAAVGTLVRDHLAEWLPPFCERVAAESPHDFYRALAIATPEWVAELLTRIGAGDAGGK